MDLNLVSSSIAASGNRGKVITTLLEEGIMSGTAIFVNSLVLSLLVLSLIKDRKKTGQAIKVALRTIARVLPMTIMVLVAIGLLLGLLPPGKIATLIGEQSGFMGIVVVALVGAVLFIPPLIAFPIVASLLEEGAPVMVAAAFVTTLTMIGFVSLPVEIRELGRRIAFLRNGFSFAATLIIALLIGVIL
jgi:uncharacterized membrane protein YraQ (UPF0718 family)